MISSSLPSCRFGVVPPLPFPSPPLPTLPRHNQGLPPILPPLPKRPALEKANGATTVLNAGVFPYQQALANMQFQQQAAFIPSGEPRVPFLIRVCGCYPFILAPHHVLALLCCVAQWMWH